MPGYVPLPRPADIAGCVTRAEAPLFKGGAQEFEALKGFGALGLPEVAELEVKWFLRRQASSAERSSLRFWTTQNRFPSGSSSTMKSSSGMFSTRSGASAYVANSDPIPRLVILNNTPKSASGFAGFRVLLIGKRLARAPRGNPSGQSAH
jgi:hypothetical protein